MMPALSDLHFLRPLALLPILALPLFWLVWRRGRADAGAWRAAVDAHLLPHLIERIDGTPARGGIVLAALAWTLACIALAGPAWEREPMPLYHNEAVRVIALELAPTMLAADEKPSRLARARYKIDDILARSRDGQAALIGYAGAAFVAAPLTDDVATVRNLVDVLDPGTMPVAGNATAAAIETAADLIEQAGRHHGDILLIADGASSDAADAARKAHARGFTVSVLGVGSASGAPVALDRGGFLKDAAGNVMIARLDTASLQAVADAGGGHYASLSVDGGDLDLLLGDRVAADTAQAAAAESAAYAQSARWRDRGPWLLLALVPLALFGFRRGWLMIAVLAVMAPAHPARAAALADLWQRPDQQAAQALAAGDAKSAAAVARSPEWRASAAYKGGDYAAAADDYARMPGADGAYNRGNALAKQGRYEEAIAAYDEALKQAPGMDDAKANRKAVEDFLKKQQQQDSAKNGKGGAQSDAKDSSAAQQNSQQQNGQGEQKQGEKQDGQQQGDQKDDAQKDSGSDAQQGSPDAQKKSQSSSSQQNGEQDKKRDDGAESAAQKDEKQERNQAAPDKGDTARDAAAQADAPKPSAQQQKELTQSIDKALADKPQDAAHKNAQQARPATREEEAAREKQQALEHMLQRVPDDPGGLLRRKFQIEYQRRQHGGGNNGS